MSQSEYYDPNTGIIHLWKADTVGVPAGGSVQTELGLEDTEFTDVKFKLLSIIYKAKIFTSNIGITSGADNNVYAFNDEEYGAGGSIIVGVKNAAETGVFNDLSDFTGTSAFPVEMTSFATLIGNPASYTKTWKPRKMALSNEQSGFLTIRQDNSFPSTDDDTDCQCYVSLYIRGIRL